MASILVSQRTDDLVIDVGDGEGGLEGSSRRHGSVERDRRGRAFASLAVVAA